MSSDRQSDRTRAVMRWILATLYVAAGVGHLRAPNEFLAITPSWVPFAPQVIFITGLCELTGSLALVTRPLRWWAGVALAVYAICVWPANFKHAMEGHRAAIPHQQLALSRPASGISAGAGVVGALLR
jgi:uncharacterized membrane protein